MPEETTGTKDENLESVEEPRDEEAKPEASEEKEKESESSEEEYERIEEEEHEQPLWRRALFWSKAARGWATVISILGATALGFYGAALKTDPTAIKAEDKAEETWKVAQAQLNTLAQEVNKLSKANRGLQASMQRLSLRVVFLQAHEAGFNQGAMHEQILALQRENDRLRKGRGLVGVTETGEVSCKEGFVEISGRCKKVGEEAAKEILEARSRAAAAKRKAEAEELQRKKAQAAQMAPAKPQPSKTIEMLPKNLDDAAQQLKGR